MPIHEAPAPAAEAVQARFQLFDAITGFWQRAAARRPLLLLLDDLHCADVPSLKLLEFVVRECADSMLLVVGTYRDAEVTRSHPLQDTVAMLARQSGTQWRKLGGFSAAETASFVKAVGGRTAPELATALHQRTDGHPLFRSTRTSTPAADGRPIPRQGAPRDRRLAACIAQVPRQEQETAMKNLLTMHRIAAATLLAAIGSVAWADGTHRMVNAAELKWTDAASLPPGAKLAVIEGPLGEAVPVTARIKFPANYTLPAHIHPHFERVTGVTGAFYMGMGSKFDAAQATMALKPGDMMIMEPNTPHFAMTKEETIVQLHGTGPWSIIYINPADDPRKK